MRPYFRIFGLAILLVLLGHFFLIEYQGLFTPIAFVLILLVVSLRLKGKEHLWELLLVMFICFHFSLGENRGGVFSYVMLFLGFLYLLRFRKFRELKENMFVNLVMFAILFNVLLGYLYTGFKNPDQVLYGLVTLISTFTIFKLTSGFKMSESRLKELLVVVGVVTVYIAIVTLNQRFSFLTPRFYTAFLPPSNRNIGRMGEILPAQEEDVETLVSYLVRPLGTFVHFELTGEYALLVFALLLPLFFFKRQLVSSRSLFVYAFSATFIIFNTINRGPIFLYPVIFVSGLLVVRPLSDRKVRKALFLVPVVFLVPLVFFWDAFVSTGFYSRVFEDTAFVGGVTPNTRAGIWDIVVPRLMEIPIAGLGMRPGPTMEVDYIGYAPHSIYIAMPFYYGWVGAAFFLGFVGITAGRLLFNSWKRHVAPYLRYVSAGLCLLWMAFLADEYKIDMFRNAQYQHLVWFLLGFSWAVLRSSHAGTLVGGENVKSTHEVPTTQVEPHI